MMTTYLHAAEGVVHPVSPRGGSRTGRVLPYLLLALMSFFAGGHAFANTVCPTGSVVEGIDVSHFTGVIDWRQVQASGKSFAFIAASTGLIEDPDFDSNYASAKAAGMIRGAYHVFLPNVDPAAQANLFLTKVGPLGPGDLPPTLDVEVSGGLTALAVRDAIGTWVAIVEQTTGRKPIIYTGASFWQTIGTPNFSTEILWVANLGGACPNIPSTWLVWTFWQYTNAFVPGIAGPVNLDRFNGSFEDLGILANIELKIDIRIQPDHQPGDVAVINPGSRGKTPVAILSTATFDAPSEIVEGSLTFGRTGDERSLAFCRPEDVNGDGMLDLVCHFRTALTGFLADDTVGVLKGETYSSRRVRGADA